MNATVAVPNFTNKGVTVVPSFQEDPVSVANQSLVVGNPSVLGRLSDGNRSFQIGYRPPTWGARKCYLLLHQPESGRCRLQVTLFIP